MAARGRVVVVDSSIALPACVADDWQFPRRRRYVAPRLMWSEVISALHEARWRREIDDAEASAARAALGRLPVAMEDPPRLPDEAWQIADELGLAKTYDAEFLALARLSDGILVTADARLRRTADRLGLVIGPVDLMEQ